MNPISAAMVLTLYFLGYGVIHSLLAATPVKRWVRRAFGLSSDHWYRLTYNIFATITLLPMLAMMVLLPSQTLYVVPSPWRWLMLGGQALAALAILFTLLQTGLFHFVGLSQLFADRPEENGSLNVGGFYAWVRHPLYTFSLVFIWLTPVMTTNTLVAFILFTIYFFIGSHYEERRLVAEFGAEYEDYRRQVPGIVPLPGRRYVAPSEPRPAEL